MPISQTFETNQAVLPIVHCGTSIVSLNRPKIKSFFLNFLGSIYFLFIITIISIKSAFMNNNKFWSLTVKNRKHVLGCCYLRWDDNGTANMYIEVLP